MKQLGLAYSVQMGPYFESPAIERANGKTVAAQSSPIQPALEQGVIVAGGTDATRIGVAGVWHAIEYHVTGKRSTALYVMRNVGSAGKMR